MNTLRFALLALLVLTVAACDSGTDIDTSDVVLYVGNAGNFSDNNGSLTSYVLDTGETVQDAVPNLGGLVQNLYSAGNEVYVLLNFSDSFTTNRGRIDVVDAVSRQRIRQLDVETPRALAVAGVSASTVGAYVTNLYSDSVTLIDLLGSGTGGEVAVGSNPEGIVRVGNRFYVANSGFGSGTTVSVIQSGAVVQTIENVCAGPRTLIADRENDVWVICTGARDFTSGAVTAPGEVVVLSGATGAVRDRFTYDDETLGSATFGQDGVIVDSGDRREIYVIANDGLIRFNTDSNVQQDRIEVPGAPIGAVTYSAARERLFLGRPDATNPFTVDGVVTVHNRSGDEIERFQAGIAPVAFTFASARRES